MERADVTGATLEYAVTGTGEPVVFIHGAFIADTFQPLLTEPSLAGHYQLITYLPPSRLHGQQPHARPYQYRAASG